MLFDPLRANRQAVLYGPQKMVKNAVTLIQLSVANKHNLCPKFNANAKLLLFTRSLWFNYELNVNQRYKEDSNNWIYEGWNFNNGNYLFTTDTK